MPHPFVTRTTARLRQPLLAALLATLLPLQAQAAGAMDRTWGLKGIVRTDIGEQENNARGAVLEPDGRLLVLATTARARGAALLHYGPLGGVELQVTLPESPGEILMGDALARQPDGRIVIAGSRTVDGKGVGFFATRLLADGTLDPTFGSQGTARLDLSGLGTLAAPGVERAVVLSSGHIWLLGHMGVLPASEGRAAVLGALLPDGRADTAVGLGGVTRLEGLNAAYDALETPDGVVVAGTRGAFSLAPTSKAMVLTRLDAVTARVDVRFGLGGRFERPSARNEGYTSLVRLDDGRLLAAGSRVNPVSSFTPLPLRLNRFQADGALDTSFVEPPVLLSNRVYLARGTTGFWIGSSLVDARGADVALLRLTDTGAADTGFGKAGLLRLDLGMQESATALVVQADGKPVLLGTGSAGVVLDVLSTRIDPAATPGVRQPAPR